MKRETMVSVFHIALIMAVALILRLVYINQLSHSYFFAPFKGGFDDYIFDTWALEIVRGNWLGDPVIYIYRMPLYVYILAGIYFLFGHSYWAVYILHSIIGAGTCGLVYAIAKRYFSPTAGLVAGLLAACYGPFLYFNGMVVGETVGIFLTVSGVWFLCRYASLGTLGSAGAAGICIGLSMLARGNMMLVLPFIIWWLFFTAGPAWRRALPAVLVLLCGCAVAVAPIMVRNYVVEKDIVPITALGGLNIYIGNSFGSDGRYHLVPKIGNNAENMIRDSIQYAEKAVGRRLKPSEVSQFWVGETVRSIGEHGTGYLFPLLVNKVVLFWNNYELPDIWDYYFYRNFLSILKLPLFNFSIIASLAAVGMYLFRRRWRDLSLMYILVIGYMCSLVAVFITSRYRMQVIPFLAVLAGGAVDEVLHNKKLRYIPLAICGGIFILAFILTNLPVIRVTQETSINSLAVLMKRTGRYEDAIALYQKAISMAPRYPSPYYNLGILYGEQGNNELAINYFRKALQADPYFAPAKERLRELGTS